MKYKLTCLYCDHKWERLISNYLTSRTAVCPRCDDRNITVKESKKSSTDYYQGSPEFRVDAIKAEIGNSIEDDNKGHLYAYEYDYLTGE